MHLSEYYKHWFLYKYSSLLKFHIITPENTQNVKFKTQCLHFELKDNLLLFPLLFTALNILRLSGYLYNIAIESKSVASRF